MPIDLRLAEYQSSRLQNYARQIRQAQQQLRNYQSTLTEHWQGREIGYIGQGIEKTLAQMEKTACQLESMSRDLLSAANAIHQEEMAQIAAARSAYDQAQQRVRELHEERRSLELMLADSTEEEQQIQLREQLRALEEELQHAMVHQFQCQAALDAARRR